MLVPRQGPGRTRELFSLPVSGSESQAGTNMQGVFCKGLLQSVVSGRPRITLADGGPPCAVCTRNNMVDGIDPS